MKNKKWIGILAVLWSLGYAVALKAEDMGKGEQAGDQPAMEEGMDSHGGSGRWKEKLGLSDSQASQVKDVFKKNRESMKPLMDQVKIDMDTLQQKVDTKASDADIKKLLDSLSSDRDKLQEGRKKMEAQLKGILNPTQQAKMVLLMKQRAKGMMGKWKGKGYRDGQSKDGGNAAPAGKTGGAEAN